MSEIEQVKPLPVVEVPTSYRAAATALVESFTGLPPAAHSVFVHTATDPETREFVHTVRIAVNTDWSAKVKVPAEIDGKPIVQVDWETLEPI